MSAVVVDTAYGRLAGACDDDGIARFVGVPYAAPPARLRSPESPAPWTGTREALRPAPASLQTLGGNQLWLNDPIPSQSEDCLFLNVWTPDVKGRAPVLVWVHGGQTRNGQGAAPGIDGTALARRGLVVVTLNYRLGALGGLAHPDLEDERTGFCANWGLQDKLAALEWVGRTIAAFGGDPANVTLAGQSSGAANVVMIAQHGLAAARYARVIAQSPPLFRPPLFVDLAHAAEYTAALAAHVGTTVRGLREVDGVALQRAEHAFAFSAELAARMGRPRTAPVRDGRLLTAWPYDAPPATVPVLTGWTREEANFWFDLKDGAGKVLSPQEPPRTPEDLEKRVGGLINLQYAFDPRPSAPAVIAAYAESGSVERRWCDVYTDLVFRAPILHFSGRQARAGQPVWVYEFAHPLPAPGAGAPHASDVPLVFGTWNHPYLASKLASSAHVGALSEAMMSAWVAFAGEGRAAWPGFDPSTPQLMRFGPERAQIVAPDRPAALACWGRYRA